jgi:hypothetical protein
MTWLMGIMGLVCGFAAGQMLLSFLLRNRSKQEILDMMKDGEARWKYGMLNWLVAALGAVSFIIIYRRWFLES